MDYIRSIHEVFDGFPRRKLSEFSRGSICGQSGEDLPYDVPVESDFALGWRHGRDVRGTLVVAQVAQTCWSGALTWPEGCEGAARHIPGMSRSDIARIREEGSFPRLSDAAILPKWMDWVAI